MDLLLSLPAFVLVFFLGSAIGSFLNVVIYRIPAGLSLLFPPSRCPHCLHRLGKTENVPILGWLRLQGRCRHCRSPISIRYPLVETATGVLFLLAFVKFGLSLQTLSAWAFLSWLLALGLIDFDTLTLPNTLTRSGLVVGLAFQTILGFAPTATPAGAIRGLMAGLVAAVLALWLFDLITFLSPLLFGQTAMGGGDAKLAALMGAWLGSWKLLLLSGFLACAIGAFVGAGVLVLGLINRRQPIPFGPFLAIAAALTLFLGQEILAVYLRVFFPLGWL